MAQENLAQRVIRRKESSDQRVVQENLAQRVVRRKESSDQRVLLLIKES